MRAELTLEEFQRRIEIDPGWAQHLTHPVIIHDYCDLRDSKITHLSPHMYFSGSDTFGRSASFMNCPNLKVAEGNFRNGVDFGDSGVERIGDLKIEQPDDNGVAADFSGCKKLREVHGTFPGQLQCQNSGVVRVFNLNITQASEEGEAARVGKPPRHRHRVP